MNTQNLVYITPTLYSSWYFWKAAPESNKQNAFSLFMKTLTKSPFPITPNMQLGLDYERKIQAMAERINLGIPFDENDTTPDVDKQIADLLQSCIWQYSVKKLFTLLDGSSVLLFGRVDAFDPLTNTIYDLKYTSSKFSQNMYEHSIQHLVYMYCLSVPKFRYIVRNSTKKFDAPFLTDDYFNLPVEQLLQDRLNNFLFSINQSELLRISFYQHWIRKV